MSSRFGKKESSNQWDDIKASSRTNDIASSCRLKYRLAKNSINKQNSPDCPLKMGRTEWIRNGPPFVAGNNKIVTKNGNGSTISSSPQGVPRTAY